MRYFNGEDCISWASKIDTRLRVDGRAVSRKRNEIDECSCASLSFERYDCEAKFLYYINIDKYRYACETLWKFLTHAIHTSLHPAIRMYTSDCSSPPSPPDKKDAWKCFEYSMLDRTVSTLKRANAFSRMNFHRHVRIIASQRTVSYTLRTNAPQFIGDSGAIRVR